MKMNKALVLSLIAPLMIVISTVGLYLKQDSKKIFYLPIGLMGVFIILEKDISRKMKRRKILKKISNYKKVKCE